MATEFTEASVKEFLLRNGGKVKNHELVTHFKNFLNDSSRKGVSFIHSFNFKMPKKASQVTQRQLTQFY